MSCGCKSVQLGALGSIQPGQVVYAKQSVLDQFGALNVRFTPNTSKPPFPLKVSNGMTSSIPVGTFVRSVGSWAELKPPASLVSRAASYGVTVPPLIYVWLTNLTTGSNSPTPPSPAPGGFNPAQFDALKQQVEQSVANDNQALAFLLKYALAAPHLQRANPQLEATLTQRAYQIGMRINSRRNKLRKLEQQGAIQLPPLDSQLLARLEAATKQHLGVSGLGVAPLVAAGVWTAVRTAGVYVLRSAPAIIKWATAAWVGYEGFKLVRSFFTPSDLQDSVKSLQEADFDVWQKAKANLPPSVLRDLENVFEEAQVDAYTKGHNKGISGKYLAYGALVLGGLFILPKLLK